MCQNNVSPTLRSLLVVALANLRHLARDRSGNVLAIVAASMIPLLAMVGSGVDLSRAYMAKSRLQAACDAGALAGRRVMVGDTFSSAVTTEAVRYFNFNFPQGSYQTTAFTPAVTPRPNGTVRMTASTRMPTTIMRMFGFSTLPLNVTCDASQNFVNTDIMLVLDTTGSMAEDVNGNSTSVLANQKIQALRDAVMAMYDALAAVQTQLQGAGMRLRYGVLPYSSTVNVGRLLGAVNQDYLTSTTYYQSRVANYATPTSVANAPTTGGAVQEVYALPVDQATCAKYGNNQPFLLFAGGANPVSGGGPAPIATTSTHYANDNRPGYDWGYPGGATILGLLRSCRRWATTTTTTYGTRYSFTNWTYRREAFDTSVFRTGVPVTVAGNTGGTTATISTNNIQQLLTAAPGVGTTTNTWNGCIEERDTVSTIDTSTNLAIPAGAYDLNPDLIPSTDATRWRPMWPELSYLRNGTSTMSRGPTYYACPTEARRLRAWTRADLLTYVNSLAPVGFTYHDIGMIWGTRMMSSGGVFADSPTTFAGMPVSRHIIFMTDGQLQPNASSYSAYGIENLDTRVTGSTSATRQFERHLQRFKMMCNRARSMNISIWVIAFGTSLSQDMIDCASNANQASTATNRQQLIDRFTQIGQQIGALRLSQ